MHFIAIRWSGAGAVTIVTFVGKRLADAENANINQSAIICWNAGALAGSVTASKK
jgi:hypothetical protein